MIDPPKRVQLVETAKPFVEPFHQSDGSGPASPKDVRPGVSARIQAETAYVAPGFRGIASDVMRTEASAGTVTRRADDTTPASQTTPLSTNSPELT